MKKLVSKLSVLSIILVLLGIITCPLVFADVSVSGERDDMEVKTYLNKITMGPENYLADEGGRLRLSGWDLNQIGGEVTTPDYAEQALGLTDTSPILPVEAKREFEAITYGDLDFYFDVKISSGVKDAVISLRQGNNPVILYGIDKDCIWVQTPEGRKDLKEYKLDSRYLVYTKIHMDKKTFDVYIDNKLYAQDIKFNATQLDNFFASSGNETVGKIQINKDRFSLKRGYWIDETFDRGDGMNLPANWSMKTVDKTTGKVSDASVQYGELPGIKIGEGKGITTLSKSFERQTRDFTAEFYVRIPEGCADTDIELVGDGNTVFKFTADDKSFYYQDSADNPVKVYDSYKKDLWYIIWVEVDFSNHTFDLYIDDKKAAENIPLKTSAVSVDTFKASGGSKSPFYMSGVQVYPTERFDDYVPEPQTAASDGVDIGMQYFGLWNEGEHFGWDWVNDSDFRRPLDGFYDEESVEHWDWQIKYWLEHGIDYVAPCWYVPGRWNSSEPVRERHPFFKAKYSDKMKFALLMESAGWAGWDPGSDGGERWLYEVGRQMVEYYFKDPRYYTNGGHPVVFMFGWENIQSAFSNSNQILEKLGDMCEAEGLGRPIYILSFYEGFDNWDSGALEGAKAWDSAAGFYHYSLGGLSHYAMDINLRHNNTAKENNLSYVPTISTGFDDYGWNRSVGYRRDAELVKWELEQYKEKILPTKNDFSVPMLNLATWNEWGEGHYFGPSEGYGFAMLDAVRDVLTDSGSHTDITPNEQQKDRFNNRYPWWRKTRVREVNVGEKPASDSYEKYVWNFDNPASLGWEAKNSVPAVLEDGVWKLTSDNNIIINLTDGDIDTADVTHIKIRMKNKGGGNAVSTSITTPFWNTAASNRTMHTELTVQNMNDTDDFVDFYIPVGIYTEFWRGILNGMEVIFEGYTPGQTMEIDSIAFVAAPQKNDISISLDGWTSSDTPVIIKNDMSMFAVRDIVYKLKGQVWYDMQTGKVWIKNGEALAEFTPGNDTVIFDGQEYTLPSSSALENGTTWIDAQMLSLVFKKHSSWDADERKFILTDVDKEFEVPRPNSERKTIWSYEFDDTSGMKNCWGMNGLSIAGGICGYVTSGTDPQFTMDISPVDISEAKIISVGIKNDAPIELQVFFMTNASPNISEDKSYRLNVAASDDIQEYVIDVKNNPAFAGALTGFRVDSGAMDGVACGIDYIRVYGDFEREPTDEEISERVDCRVETKEGIVWDFNVNTRRDGWLLSRSFANSRIRGGVLTADVICKTPFFETAERNLSVDAEEYDSVKFCLKNSSEASKVKVYFTTELDPEWSEDKCKEINIAKNSSINIAYSADFSDNAEWNGKIKALKIAVESVASKEDRGEIGIDYIKLLKK